MSMNMYYSYQIHDRLNVYSPMLRSGRQIQQYVVTVYCSIELDRKDYIRRKQKDIRSEYLSGLYDAIDRGDQSGSNVGSRTILFASFTGRARYMYNHYLDALAIFRAYPRLTPSDQTDVVARVFYMKVKEFIVFLKEQKPLGDFRGGPPHCHTLLWLHSTSSPPITERLDDYISAELPDPRSDPAGYAVILATMMHGPCGVEKPRAPCMECFACKKKFPKKYNNKTFFDADGCAHYRRCSTGVYTTRIGVKLDNSYVVPYNRLLCMTFHAHINVECCGSTSLIKYLFKYISKGTDRVASRISKPIGSGSQKSAGTSQSVDEVQNFIDARFICPHEACWRIFKFPIHHREPAVQILAVHLENMQLIKFHEQQRLTSVIANNLTKKSTLTDWLCYNASSSLGKNLTIWNFLPNLFGMTQENRGCQSFDDIKNVNKVVHSTYRLACHSAGLLGDDKEWATALEEASAYATSSIFAPFLLIFWYTTWSVIQLNSGRTIRN
ncbi:uncharacterized protein [Rutidosis leptorrhynchoides]|uniref:uncharacterized protein n=1 Tax=Rutidosis leptorrhynchoides TaxID=125765 RepID=UPI003A999146